MSPLVEKASAFARTAHASHARKYTGEPYFNHLVEVADLVSGVGGSAEMVAAAYLHDTVEDCNIAISEIESEFGPTVASLVAQLTDCSTLGTGNRAIRKKQDLAHIQRGTPDAKTIKLADLISNSRSIVEHDPRFAAVYMAEKRELLTVLTEGNRELFRTASRIVEDYYRNK